MFQIGPGLGCMPEQNAADKIDSVFGGNYRAFHQILKDAVWPKVDSGCSRSLSVHGVFPCDDHRWVLVQYISCEILKSTPS